LVLKALGVRAYRRGEWPQAVKWLHESARNRVTDAQLFLYLGLAQRELNQSTECTESLRKALSLGLKAAEVGQANKTLASLSTPQQ